MVDLHLKSETESDMIAAIPFAHGYVDEEAQWLTSENFTLDVVGRICIVDGVYDEEGEVITEPVYDNAFHLNMRCDDDIAALVPNAVKVTPTTPIRVWF